MENSCELRQPFDLILKTYKKARFLQFWHQKKIFDKKQHLHRFSNNLESIKKKKVQKVHKAESKWRPNVAIHRLKLWGTVWTLLWTERCLLKTLVFSLKDFIQKRLTFKFIFKAFANKIFTNNQCLRQVLQTTDDFHLLPGTRSILLIMNVS